MVGSSFLAGVGNEIRRGVPVDCSRHWATFLGGWPGLFPASPSAHYTRLLHVGWGQCGPSFSSRPRIHSLFFFWYPEGAATALYGGTLKLRYLTTPLAGV